MKTKADKILYALETTPWGMTAMELMTAIKNSSLPAFYANLRLARRTAWREGYLIGYRPETQPSGKQGRAPGRYVLERYKRDTAK